jgi:energy-coupling factor transport system ATP-binding protein
MHARVREALALVGLDGLERRSLTTLSGGERQRVAIAGALALQPEVLVLDEPTSQLDDDAAAALLTSVVDLTRRKHLTVLMSEHRVDRVIRHADRVIHIRDRGEAPLCGRPSEILPGVVRHTVSKPPPGRPGKQVLEVEHVTYGYGTEQVLDRANLVVRSSEVVALTGPSGSGKTTLLRLCVGLLTPHGGAIAIAGEPVDGHEVAEICRSAGYLPQDPGALLFADTVREELAITLANHGIPESGAHSPDKMLDRLGIQDLAGRYPRDLSTGQRQRVALGAIAVTNPVLLLLDEPTRGLDDVAIAGLAELLHSMAAAGSGVLIATHDRRLAGAAHRALRLRSGSVEE